MAREKRGLLAVPRTVPVLRDVLPVYYACPSFGLQPSQVHAATAVSTFVPVRVVRSFKNAFCVFPRGILWHAFCVWILRYNARAAVDEYQRRFPDRRIPSRGVFSRIHQTMHETCCLPSVAVQSEREVYHWLTRERTFLRWFREVRDCPLVELALASACHLCRYGELYMREFKSLPWSQGTTSGTRGSAQRMDLCQWIIAHTELLSVILYTDEASFTWDGINN